MKTERPAFAPLDTDLTDQKLEHLAREKGVGTLQKPVREDEKGARGTPPAPVLLPEPPNSGATPRARMKALSVELPDYVWTELKIRAAHNQTSVRHIIMSALVKDGISIAEADMVEDGRRLRGRAQV